MMVVCAKGQSVSSVRERGTYRDAKRLEKELLTFWISFFFGSYLLEVKWPWRRPVSWSVGWVVCRSGWSRFLMRRAVTFPCSYRSASYFYLNIFAWAHNNKILAVLIQPVLVIKGLEKLFTQGILEASLINCFVRSSIYLYVSKVACV